jgi:hypothetical protein
MPEVTLSAKLLPRDEEEPKNVRGAEVERLVLVTSPAND